MRPKIWHHVMTGLSALALLGTTVFAIVRWGSLDGKIPTHFDSAGQPTSYGGPEALIVLLVMAWVMLAGLTAVSFFPNIWNVPVRTPRTLAATADDLDLITVSFSRLIDRVRKDLKKGVFTAFQSI